MRKEIKNRVGRPKLADKNLKKESVIVTVIVLIMLGIIMLLSYNILSINFNPKLNLATAYNSHVNSCVIENDKISCGSNVSYMKYQINDKEFINITKEDENISVKIPVYDSIKVCYKTDRLDWTCNN